MLPGFLQHLSPTAQQTLLQHARSLHWTRGSTILHADDPADALLLIQTGHARLYQLGSGAREITMNVLSSGDLMGCRALLGQQSYGMHIDTLDDLSALSFSGEVLREQVMHLPELGGVLSAQLVRQGRQLQDRLSQLVFLEVSQRLALALLHLLEQSGSDTGNAVPLKGRISHQDLAYTVGSTRETITKVLGDFRNCGLLDLGYRRIVVTNRTGLEAAVRSPLSGGGPLS